MLCVIEEPGDHGRAEEEVGDGGGGGGETEGGGEGGERGEVGGGDGSSEGLERGTEEVGDDQPPPPPPPVAAAEAAEVYTVYTAGNDTEFVRYVDFHDQLRNTCKNFVTCFSPRKLATCTLLCGL